MDDIEGLGIAALPGKRRAGQATACSLWAPIVLAAPDAKLGAKHGDHELENSPNSVQEVGTASAAQVTSTEKTQGA